MVLTPIVLPAEQPVLETPRLRLRPMRLGDAPRVQQLAGDAAVADSTELIPHPYPDGVAEAWIATHAASWADARECTWAIAWRADDALVGAMSIHFNLRRRMATAGYWVGTPYWGRGIATEALRMAIAACFDQWDLHRVQAHHLARNPASGRVMEKAGMQFEGVMRGAACKHGVMEDSVMRAVLRTDPR